MSGFSDSQSEDGELAHSPIPHPRIESHPQGDIDFSLSDDDREADALNIKPPQAVIPSSHRERKSHKRSKDRHKESSRREKKHTYRDRDGKSDKNKRQLSFKTSDRELENSTKEYYREKAYFREKDAFREKEYAREKEIHREKEYAREKEIQREKEYAREKEIQHEKEMQREKEFYRDKELAMREKEFREKEFREKDAYRERDREHYRERDLYRDNAYREKEMCRQKEYKEKDKEMQREKDVYLTRERIRYSELEHKRETDRPEKRNRSVNEEQMHEKENLDSSSADKELEDLRSRLLSKRISKELQTHESRRSKQDDKDESRKHSRANSNSSLDKNHQERRNRFVEAEREMEKRKQESRTELEQRRVERQRRRAKKRSVTPEADEEPPKKTRPESQDDSVVMVSDTSDVEIKSDSQHSDQEEGEQTASQSEEETSSGDSDSESDSKSRETKSDNEEEAQEAQEASKGDEDGEWIEKTNQERPAKDDQIPEKSLDNPSDAAGSTPPRSEALPPYFPALQGCRSVEEFQCLNRIEEGTYGVVYRARDKTTEEIVALKRLKMEKEKEGFPITSLREINTLLKSQHPNIVTVREIVVGSNMDKIFIVMDYVEHDLKSLMETMRNKKQVFLPGEVKCLMRQLLQAVHHLHDNWILHRDLKTSNLLLSHKGILKVGDFGLAREYGSPLGQYTPVVVTLWYRAPELLLCGKEYSTPIDVWSVGCIFAEFVTMNPLFPGKTEIDQLNKIFKDLGTPSEAVWPGYSKLPAVQKMTFAEHPAGGLRARAGPDLLSDAGLALLQAFLNYDPARRISADAAVDHPYFAEQPTAIDPAMFPTWPAKSEGGRKATSSPKPPAGGAAYAQYRADDESLGFHMPPAAPQRSIQLAPGFALKF